MDTLNRIAEIGKRIENLNTERNQLQGQLLDTYIGKFFKYSPVEAEKEFTQNECTYFYAARRVNDVLVGPIVRLSMAHRGILGGSTVKLEAEYGPFFIHPKVCVEISADEFKRGIHEMLDRALIEGEQEERQ